jgi:hypothetical protein
LEGSESGSHKAWERIYNLVKSFRSECKSLVTQPSDSLTAYDIEETGLMYCQLWAMPASINVPE